MSYKLCKNEQLVSQMSIITLQTGPAWPNYAHNASPSKSQGWSTLSSAVSRQSAIFLAGGGTLQWSAHCQALARQEMSREEIVLLLYKYLLTRLSTDYSKVNQILKSMKNFNSPVIKKNTQTQVCWKYEIKKSFLFIWAWGFFKTRQLLVDCELPFKMWTRNCRGGAELSSWVFILHWLLHNVLPDCVVIVRYNFLVVQLIRASVRYSGPVGLSYVMSTIQSAFSLTTLEKTQFQNLFDCKIWF